MIWKDRPRLARADYEATDLETVMQDLLSSEYSNPIRVIAFNTSERWSEDVSPANCADAAIYMRELPTAISDFVERARRARHSLQIILLLQPGDGCPMLLYG